MAVTSFIGQSLILYSAVNDIALTFSMNLLSTSKVFVYADGVDVSAKLQITSNGTLRTITAKSGNIIADSLLVLRVTSLRPERTYVTQAYFKRDKRARRSDIFSYTGIEIHERLTLINNGQSGIPWIDSESWLDCNDWSLPHEDVICPDEIWSWTGVSPENGDFGSMVNKLDNYTVEVTRGVQVGDVDLSGNPITVDSYCGFYGPDDLFSRFDKFYMEVDVLSPDGEFSQPMLQNIIIGVSEGYIVDPETGYHWDAYNDAGDNASGMASANEFCLSDSIYWRRNNQVPTQLTNKLRMGQSGAYADNDDPRSIGGNSTKALFGSPAGTDTLYNRTGGNTGFSVSSDLICTVCISMDGPQGIGWVAIVGGETDVTFRPPVPPYWEGWHGDTSGYLTNTQTQTRYDWSYPSASYVGGPITGDTRNRCFPISHNNGPYVGPTGITQSTGTVSDYIANGNKAYPFLGVSLPNSNVTDRAIQFRIRGSSEHPNRWPTPVGYNVSR
jgi:hypothetical protein